MDREDFSHGERITQPMLWIARKPSCAGAAPTNNQEIRQPFPLAKLPAEGLCLRLSAEAPDEDPPPLFPLWTFAGCGEGWKTSLKISRGYLLSFCLGPEDMDLDGIRGFTPLPGAHH